MAIVGRCRRLGWPVETGTGASEWVYRIQCPDGTKIQLHSSPSDRNWEKHVLLKLNRHGDLDNAEREWLAAEAERKRLALAADREKNDRKTAAAAKRALAVQKAAGELAIHEPDIGWLTTPSDVIQTKVMRITPEVAQKLLDTINTANRPIRQTHVDALAQAIDDGDWSQTHQGGAVDWDGKLQDGQHRLLAIVQSGKTVIMPWTVGLDPKNFAKIDVGSQRVARDVAAMRGEKNLSVLTSAARMLLNIEMYGPEAHVRGNKAKISVYRVDLAVQEYGEELREAVSRAIRMRREIRINASGVAAAIYMIRQRLPEGDPRVERFLNDLETGVGLDASDPVWMLRRLIFRSLNNSFGASAARQLRAFDVCAYVIKTWNLRASGRQVTQVVWRSNEAFPSTVFLPPPPAEFSEKAS